MMLQLTEEKLKELLSKAYEAGWHGIRELNESAVGEIFKQFIDSQPRSVPVSNYTVSSVMGVSPIQVNWGGSGNWIDTVYQASTEQNQSIRPEQSQPGE